MAISESFQSWLAIETQSFSRWPFNLWSCNCNVSANLNSKHSRLFPSKSKFLFLFWLLSHKKKLLCDERNRDTSGFFVFFIFIIILYIYSFVWTSLLLVLCLYAQLISLNNVLITKLVNTIKRNDWLESSVHDLVCYKLLSLKLKQVTRVHRSSIDVVQSLMQKIENLVISQLN